MHNLCTCTSNIHDMALFGISVCGFTYMCTHNCVWYDNRGRMCVCDCCAVMLAYACLSLVPSQPLAPSRPPSLPLPPLSAASGEREGRGGARIKEIVRIKILLMLVRVRIWQIVADTLSLVSRASPTHIHVVYRRRGSGHLGT